MSSFLTNLVTDLTVAKLQNDQLQILGLPNRFGRFLAAVSAYPDNKKALPVAIDAFQRDLKNDDERRQALGTIAFGEPAVYMALVQQPKFAKLAPSVNWIGAHIGGEVDSKTQKHLRAAIEHVFKNQKTDNDRREILKQLISASTSPLSDIRFWGEILLKAGRDCRAITVPYSCFESGRSALRVVDEGRHFLREIVSEIVMHLSPRDQKNAIVELQEISDRRISALAQHLARKLGLRVSDSFG